MFTGHSIELLRAEIALFAPILHYLWTAHNLDHYGKKINSRRCSMWKNLCLWSQEKQVEY